MAKIYKVRINEQPTEANLVAEKPWAWCEDRLGLLMRLGTEKLFKLTEKDAHPFRGSQYVLVHLEEAEGGAVPDWYFSSTVRAQELDAILKEG